MVFERHYIDEDKLKDVIPETAYEDLDGNLRSMERDLLKEYGDGEGANYFAIARFGIGNQTTVESTMLVRLMGYDYTVYKRQFDEYNNKKRDLLTEGAIDKKHNFKQLRYPVEALDMLYAYTKDEHYLNIRNKILRKEQEGDV